MSNTGVILSIFIALALPISWVVVAVASAHTNEVRIPVRIDKDDSLRSIKVFIRNR